MAGTTGDMTNYTGVDTMSIPQKKLPLVETHPELAKQWSSRNTKQPEEVFFGSDKKVWWICEEGHEWEASPNSRTNRKSGCPYCSGRFAISGINDLSTTHPHLVAEWSDKNSISPDKIKAGMNKKVWWVCAEGHEWEASPNNRTNGRTNCPVCAGQQIIHGFNDLATKHNILVSEWSIKNEIPPELVTLGSGKKVLWVCDKGHEWEAVVKDRTRKNKPTGCPKCACIGTSKPERTLIELLSDTYTVQPQHPIYYENNKRIIVDGLVISNDTKYVVEYDGEYWHTGLLLRDTYKTNILLNMGYHVIRIRENNRNPAEKMNINHPHFLQIDYEYTREHSQLEDVIAQIIDYIGVDTVPTVV